MFQATLYICIDNVYNPTALTSPEATRTRPNLEDLEKQGLEQFKKLDKDDYEKLRKMATKVPFKKEINVLTIAILCNLRSKIVFQKVSILGKISTTPKSPLFLLCVPPLLFTKWKLSSVI